MLNLKLARLLFADWEIVLICENSVFHQHKNLLSKLKVNLVVCENDLFTKKMLWRLKPIFHSKYTHILCRDLDAPLTLRERICVEDWILSGAVIHAITDNDQHTIPLMGGMIGFRCERFIAHTNFQTWDELVNDSKIDFSKKGSDQDLLQQKILPLFSENYILEGTLSKCEHFLRGMPKRDFLFSKNFVPDLDLGFPKEYEESNEICLHIGSAGWIEPKINVFLQKHADKFLDLIEIERNFDVFYWANQNY